MPELDSRRLRLSTIVASLDESRLAVGGIERTSRGLGSFAVPTFVTSGSGTPAAVIASESSAGWGKAAELSPLETAVPSCALRDARSASSDMFPTVVDGRTDSAVKTTRKVSYLRSISCFWSSRLRILDCVDT